MSASTSIPSVWPTAQQQQHTGNHIMGSDTMHGRREGSAVPKPGHQDSPNRPPPKKRNRLAFSCTACREKKIKCNRMIPCDQCIKRGDERLCHIEPFKHKAAEAKAKVEEEARAAAIAAGQDPEAAAAAAAYAFAQEQQQIQLQQQEEAEHNHALEIANGSHAAADAEVTTAVAAAADENRISKSRPSNKGRQSTGGKKSKDGIAALSLTTYTTQSQVQYTQVPSFGAYPSSGSPVNPGNMTTAPMVSGAEMQEMQAIKARLAQLEAALEAKAAAAVAATGGGRLSTPSSAGASPAAAYHSNGGKQPGSPGIFPTQLQHPQQQHQPPQRSGSQTSMAGQIYPTHNMTSTVRSPVSALTGSIYSNSVSSSSVAAQPLVTPAPGYAQMTDVYHPTSAHLGTSQPHALPPFNNLFGRAPATVATATTGPGAISSAAPGVADRRGPNDTSFFDSYSSGSLLGSASGAGRRSTNTAGGVSGASNNGVAGWSAYRRSAPLGELAPGSTAAASLSSSSSSSSNSSNSSSTAQGAPNVTHSGLSTHAEGTGAAGCTSSIAGGPSYISLPNGHVRMEVDSDTEDAALVLEGLAMGARDLRDSKLAVSKLVNAAEGCPSLRTSTGSQRDAATPATARAGGEAGGGAAASKASKSVTRNSSNQSIAAESALRSAAAAPAAGTCAGTDDDDKMPDVTTPGGRAAWQRKVERCAADSKAGKLEIQHTDILDPRRMGKFGKFVECDKRVDIMLPVAEGGTSRETDEAFVPHPPGQALTGWPISGRKDTKMGDVTLSSGSVQAACDGREAKGGDADMHELSADSTTGIKSDSRDKADARDGGAESCGAKTMPCRLACENHGLFRLKQGPETLLGWGMGFAWGAAEAAGEYKTIKGSLCPGSAEREAVLRAVIRTLPNKEIASQLVDVYASRVYYLTGHVVHIPTLRREMEAFYSFDSVEKQARVLNFVDPAWLSVFLMILVLGMQFYPCYPPEHYINIQHLFDGKTIHLWYSAHKTILILARYQCSQSVAVLQAILLSDLHGAESDRTQMSLLRMAISTAQEMGLHRLGDAIRQPQPGEAPGTTILREMYKRIWWSLVWRDWVSCLKVSNAYSIHPGQFNTPYPGNYNDEDLCQSPLPPPKPPSEHTEMSFVLSKLMIADAARENVDLLNQRDMEGARDGTSRHLTCQDTSRLDARFRAILENVPSFFQVGSDVGAGTDIEVQRWLLQQGVFSKLLRLHRGGLSSRTKSRTSCVLLARSILDMQKKVRSRCTVVDRLWFILMQSFNAAVVLCLDLFSTPSPPAMREIIRSEIGEALDSLRLVQSTNPNVSRCIRILEALLAEEEMQWKRRGEGGNNFANEISAGKRKRGDQAQGAGRKAVLSLALRIKRAIEDNPLPEDGDAAAASTQETRSNDAETASASATAPAKDAFAKELMEQLMHPQFTAENDQSSAANFPYLVNTGQQYTLEQQAVAPNGVITNMRNAPPDGQPFDLSTFLAQYESPPSGSDDMQSILSSNSSVAWSPENSNASSRPSVRASGSSTDLTSNASSVERLSLSRQGSSDQLNLKRQDLQQQQHAQQQFVGRDAIEPTTGLDSFWDWILGQGGTATQSIPSMQQPSPQSQQQPAPPQSQTQTQVQTQAQAQTPNSQSAGQQMISAPAPSSQPQQPDPNAITAPDATPESYFAQLPGRAPMLNGSLLPTPMPALQSEGPMTPSKAAGVTGFEGYGSAYGLNQPAGGAPASASTPFSMGTPSSGFDSWFATSLTNLESFMQTD
ncbi:hypothetical protein K437DRAFT_254264 [Tilletiaria anomala UBC 951]|uniref:Zn(2)-C6 fungal-type domain-containing protein n=1 Tax=Tilletiaria anomala (strain ATCC 24038 / CBS 436.72 / UBC 951) TaxID=1037660 RepID=A0A066WEW0_TILAU|nr:uncharacterized protein K437DRAFT_254264 [Tilletiaria anomala UBC 951]KDN52482.1 hypothetical protein K437DRAFT_254264 [Tilletiaria anomala UBC 951]